jgi:hypothetical protein
VKQNLALAEPAGKQRPGNEIEPFGWQSVEERGGRQGTGRES